MKFNSGDLNVNLLGADMVSSGHVVHAGEWMLEHLTGCKSLSSIKLKHPTEDVPKVKPVIRF